MTHQSQTLPSVFNSELCCDAANTVYESLWLLLYLMHMLMVQNDKVMTLSLVKQTRTNDAWIDYVNYEWNPYATHIHAATHICLPYLSSTCGMDKMDQNWYISRIQFPGADTGEDDCAEDDPHLWPWNHSFSSKLMNVSHMGWSWWELLCEG